MPTHKENYTAPFLLILAIAIVVLFSLWSKHDSQVEPPPNWVNGWLEVNPFTIPRRALAVAATEHFLYVVGGVDDHDDYVLPVEFAPIHEDGTLGSWQKTSSLQEGRFYLAAVVHDGFLYALGGGGGELGDNNVPLASVERARIQQDGTLGPWELHSYLTTPRRGLKSAIINNQLYAIGGYNGTFLRSTERLDLRVPGNSQWLLEPNQAKIDRYIHASAAHNKRLFLLGGHTEQGDTMSYGDVESSEAGASGQLSEWQIAESRLLVPRFIASAFSLGEHLYLVGGHNGIQRLASVEMTRVHPNGLLDPWTLLAPLNRPRSATAAAVTGSRVYIAGGMDNQQVLNSVEMANYLKNGALGYVISKENSLEAAGQLRQHSATQQ